MLQRLPAMMLIAALACIADACVQPPSQPMVWPDKLDFTAGIGGCTAPIDAGQLKGGDLAKPYFARGDACVSEGQFDRAIADFDQAIRLDPRNAGAFHDRGTAHDRKGQFDRAIADYDQAIQLRPDLAVAFTDRGIVFTEMRQYDRAITDFGQAIRLDPKYALAFSSRGIAYAFNKQFDRAIADYGQAIRLNPHDAVAFNNRGAAYDQQDSSSAPLPTSTRPCALIRTTRPPSLTAAWSALRLDNSVRPWRIAMTRSG